MDYSALNAAFLNMYVLTTMPRICGPKAMNLETVLHEMDLKSGFWFPHLGLLLHSCTLSTIDNSLVSVRFSKQIFKNPRTGFF